MIFTEEHKAFVRFLYPIIDYGLRRVMTEFPGKRRNTFGFDNLITKLLKKGMSKRTHRRLCVSLTTNERRDRLFGLKACMLVNGKYFEHRMKC